MNTLIDAIAAAIRNSAGPNLASDKVEVALVPDGSPLVSYTATFDVRAANMRRAIERGNSIGLDVQEIPADGNVNAGFSDPVAVGPSTFRITMTVFHSR